MSSADGAGPPFGGGETVPTSPESIVGRLRALASPLERDKIAKRVPVEQVIGVRMGTVFDLARSVMGLPLDDVRSLLRSEWYEARLVGVCILDYRARARGVTDDERCELFETYLAEHAGIDSWDLVDRAAPHVVGAYLVDRDHGPLSALARSPRPMERRTAITAAFVLIRARQTDTPLALLDILLDDPEHFVQTSVGVALRELRRASPDAAQAFLDTHDTRIAPTSRRLMADRRGA